MFYVQMSLASAKIRIHTIHHSMFEHHLDFSKAIDTVNHAILMSKHLHNDLRHVMQSWFRSYLSNRKHNVSVKNSSSSMSNIKLGVPQGPVLGPVLLFCLSMACINPQTRCALFILLTIQQFLHPTVTLTMFMPL